LTDAIFFREDDTNNSKNHNIYYSSDYGYSALLSSQRQSLSRQKALMMACVCACACFCFCVSLSLLLFVFNVDQCHSFQGGWH
jgi:hypothetical protein